MTSSASKITPAFFCSGESLPAASVILLYLQKLSEELPLIEQTVPHNTLSQYAAVPDRTACYRSQTSRRVVLHNCHHPLYQDKRAREFIPLEYEDQASIRGIFYSICPEDLCLPQPGHVAYSGSDTEPGERKQKSL